MTVPTTRPTPPAKTTKTVALPKAGFSAHFIHRDKMRRTDKEPGRVFKMPKVPDTPLPCDCTGNASVSCPMDGNDQFGDCGMAMAAHVDNILTFAQGTRTESTFAEADLVKQYLAISGGDNGMDETMVVGPGGVWLTGIAYNAEAVVVDSLDVPGDAATIKYCIDQFYGVEMAWSVPDLFIQNWQPESSFLSAMTPDASNGHYTPLSDIDADGNYRLWTWGSWSWVSDSFVQSVQPVFFVVFSARQFDPATGLDSKGRHITAQAALWQAAGGNAIPDSVLSSFPPANGPTPVPVPGPGPAPVPVPVPVPTPAATITVGQDLAGYCLVPTAALQELNAKIGALLPRNAGK
jgi:hypothetical protein